MEIGDKFSLNTEFQIVGEYKEGMECPTLTDPHLMVPGEEVYKVRFINPFGEFYEFFVKKSYFEATTDRWVPSD